MPLVNNNTTRFLFCHQQIDHRSYRRYRSSSTNLNELLKELCEEHKITFHLPYIICLKKINVPHNMPWHDLQWIYQPHEGMTGMKERVPYPRIYDCLSVCQLWSSRIPGKIFKVGHNAAVSCQQAQQHPSRMTLGLKKRETIDVKGIRSGEFVCKCSAASKAHGLTKCKHQNQVVCLKKYRQAKRHKRTTSKFSV